MKSRMKYVLVVVTAALCLIISGGLLVSAEVSAPADINSPDVITITLSKTVGTDPSVCATGENITVAPGTEVFYCYEVTNSGNLITLDSHTLIDDKLGTLLNNFVLSLAPSASTFITQSAMITETTVNSATWYSTHALSLPQPKADDTAVVNVPAPAIAITKTVGLNDGSCATTSAITVTAGTTVYYCYTLSNNGLANISSLTVTDDQLGAILTNDSTVIAPSASIVVTRSAVMNANTTNVATFSAIEAHSNAAAGPVTSSATVNTEIIPTSIAIAKTVGLSGSSCATTTTITVTVGTTVYYCYTLSNNGVADISSLTVSDDQLGAILTNDSTVIAPSASIVVTRSAVISADTTSIATFSAIEANSNAAAGPVTSSVTVNTEITEYKVYLPILMR